MARAGVRCKQPLYPVHVVVGPARQRDYILMVLAQGPSRRIVVLANASYNSLLGARGRILWQLGLGSIFR